MKRRDSPTTFSVLALAKTIALSHDVPIAALFTIRGNARHTAARYAIWTALSRLGIASLRIARMWNCSRPAVEKALGLPHDGATTEVPPHVATLIDRAQRILDEAGATS